MKFKPHFTLILFALLSYLFAQAQDSPRLDGRWDSFKKRVAKANYNYDEFKLLPNLNHHPSHFTEEETNLSAILSDFQVNENAGLNGAAQFSPSIVTDGNGHYVITWTDNRNGNLDIYAQLYASDGTLPGSNFKVNDDIGSAWQLYPSIAVDGSGNFVITWQDGRDREFDIYVQRYTSDGAALGSNYKVNDNDQEIYLRYPSITLNGDGSFVIVWEDYRNGDADIYAQRYNSNGAAMGNNFNVIDDVVGAYQGSPSIEIDGSGNFTICWEDKRNGNYDIYAQRYTVDGSILGSNFKVNNDAGNLGQRNPALTAGGNGNFVITWQDYRNDVNNADIFAQRYASDGSVLGNNFKVTDEVGNAEQSNPAIAIDGSGNYVIAWQDYRKISWDIYAQRYTDDGTALGNNFEVNDGGGSAFNPSIAIEVSGDFVVTWEDDRNYYLNDDIYANYYRSDGTASGSNFKLNDDPGTAEQSRPTIATDNNDNFVIVWEDQRNGIQGSIYAQRYESDGTTMGNNFKVNDDTARAFSPAIAMASNGNFVVTWEDERNGDYDIYAQRYANDGTAFGGNFKVTDDISNIGQWNPSIAMDNIGNFVITWQDSRGEENNIYAQRFNKDGVALESNFRINDNMSNVFQYSPSISMDFYGNFIITWEDWRNNDSDIYAQRFTSNGSALGINFKVNDDAGFSYQKDPAISMDGGGNIVICWGDDRNGNYDIYAQQFTSEGVALGSNFKVNDDTIDAEQYLPSIATDSNGNFVVIWEEYRNIYSDIYAQRYTNNGESIENNFRVTNISNLDQSYPIVKLWNSRIYTTWMDNRIREFEYDIWANVLDWNNPVNLINDDFTQKPADITLKQNFPNPFNPTTTIEYSLPVAIKVQLSVYDLLGKKVAELVNENQAAGFHQVAWDAGNLASGVYVYRIQAGEFGQVRKMLFLK